MIVVLAGRRIDAPDAATPRFPLRNVSVVEKRIRDLFTARGSTSLIAAAACGADLIGQGVARSLGLARVMVMPYQPDVFRARSVVDRPGNWGVVFDDLLADARSRPENEVVDLGLSTDPANSQAVYRQTNEALLERADELATRSRESVLAVAVWDGKSRGKDDLTAAFVASAERRRILVEHIETAD